MQQFAPFSFGMYFCLAEDEYELPPMS